MKPFKVTKIQIWLLVLVPLFSSSLAFSEAVSEEEVNNLTQELGEETMSPFCPGRTLQACPSEDARQLKLQITSLLSMGYSKDAIRRKLLAEYGEKISGLPANNSFKKIAWLSPALFVITGLLIVYFGLRFMRNKIAQTESEINLASPDLLEIEKKLRK